MAVFVSVALVSISAQAGEAAQVENFCPEGVINIVLPQPPLGMRTRTTVSLDEKCQPVYGPIEYVSVWEDVSEQAPSNYVEFKPIVGDSGFSLQASGCFRARWTLLDKVNITLNEVYGDVCRGWNGSTLTSYSVSGGYNYHTENPSGGWSPHYASNTQTAGCVGCANAQFRQYCEFSYQGLFDPFGTVYYNSVAVYDTIYGTGTKACSYSIAYRTWSSSLWHTTTQCG